MAKLTWHNNGDKRYETGVDRGVLFLPDQTGEYKTGYAWNGLTAVNESPSGAEPTKQYADNAVYLTLVSAEEFGATIEAYTWPDKFSICDGSAEPSEGVYVGQQPRQNFALAYRTKIGDDVAGMNKGYKLHIIYNALAAPSERAYSTVNESPEAATFSWELSTTPVRFDDDSSTATIIIDSTKVPAAKLEAFEDIIYGTASVEPSLPSPSEVIAHFKATTLIP